MKIQTKLILVLCTCMQFQELQGMASNITPANDNIYSKSVADTVPPVAYCITGGITVSLPASGCILIWARDLDRGSFDDITPINKLKFYLNGNRNLENIQICCSDFIAAGACDEYSINFDMWVEDEQGNASVCKTTVIIQDDLDACACQSSGYSMKGHISNICNYRSEASLKLSGPNNYLRESFGPFIGFYELLNGQYQLCLARNDNPLNGVSTTDIVKIQRHILGVELFTNNNLLLAADVNNSNTITAADISEIRKLVLGLKTKFSVVPSWIFVPSDSMANPKHVLHVGDYKTGCWDLNINNASLDSVNFVSIKMGDVNCSAKLNGEDNIQKRNSKTQFTINYSTTYLDNQLLKSNFYLENNSTIQGFQFSLQFDPSLLEFDKIQSGEISILDEQISLRDLSEGKIHIAWDKNQMDRNHAITGKLFSILWKKKNPSTSNLILTLDPSGIQPLIIDASLNEIDLTLQNSDRNLISRIDMRQNLENQMIQVDGQIANEKIASISIVDMTGHLILQKPVLLNEGVLHETISLQNFPANTIYFLRIQSGQFSKSWKVLKML